MELFIKMPDDFPGQEVIDISHHLLHINVLVADYPDPNNEVYFVGNYLGIEQMNEIETILLPDLNVVSLMVHAAKGLPLDEHGRNAAAILAFAQCMDIQIEPSIAFHELGFSVGNQTALEKLSWFRVADQGNPHEWIAAALGRRDRILTIGKPLAVRPHELASPLKRWRLNYIAALKMGELELNNELNAIQKVTALLAWMRDDFILAGPAAILAFLYFAPNSPPRKGLLKDLKVRDRQKALAGARNAAWDITYLSDFARRINEASELQGSRYIFATFDKRLLDLARFVIGEYEEMGAHEGLAKSFERWWTAKDAQRIADLWVNCMTRVRSPDWWDQYKGQTDYVGELIDQGEAVLLNWTFSD